MRQSVILFVWLCNSWCHFGIHPGEPLTQEVTQSHKQNDRLRRHFYVLWGKITILSMESGGFKSEPVRCKNKTFSGQTSSGAVLSAARSMFCIILWCGSLTCVSTAGSNPHPIREGVKQQLLYCRVGIGYHLQILSNGSVGGVHKPTENCESRHNNMTECEEE